MRDNKEYSERIATVIIAVCMLVTSLVFFVSIIVEIF